MSIINGSTATHLDFQNQRYFVQGESKTFDNLVTFSRGSLATVVDSTGKITYAPNNLLLQSQTFSSASWIKQSGATVSGVKTTAPDGTLTADTISFPTQFSGVRQTPTLTPFTTYIVSVWARRDSGSNALSFYGTSPNTLLGTFSPTSTWTRYSVVFTTGASPYTEIYVLQDRNASGFTDVNVWGAQLEAVTYQTAPSDYRATTSAAYYGPRFDYDPITLQPKGLLVEEQRTNLVLYSEVFGFSAGATWGYAYCTVTENVIISPSGTLTADQLTNNTTNGTHGVYQSMVFSTGSTMSVYAKAGTTNFVGITNSSSSSLYSGATFNLATGTVGTTSNCTASITPVGNGWYRCVVANTTTYAGAYFVVSVLESDQAPWLNYAGTNKYIYIWGGQVEAGAFATSYIPTTSASVQRNYELTSITGTNFSSWYNRNEGTFVVNFLKPNVRALTFPCIFAAREIALASSNTIEFYATESSINSLVRYDSGLNWDNALIFTAVGTNIKGALAYQVGNYATAVGGSIVATNSSTNALNSPITLNIGYNSTIGQISGYIMSIKYYNRRLPDSVLQSLTA